MIRKHKMWAKVTAALLVIVAILFQGNQNMLIADAAERTDEAAVYSYYPVYNEKFDHTYTFYSSKWGVTLKMEVPVGFEISYSYSEGSWSEVYYSNISVYYDQVTVNGVTAKVENAGYLADSYGAERWIIVNKEQKVYIYITCNEWGRDYGAELED